MQEPRPFFGRIESLRGIGALAVAGYHISGWALHGRQLLPHDPWPAASAAENAWGRLMLVLFPGHAALMMFFAISGCVLVVSLQYGPQTFAAATRRFFIARVFRIYPIVVFGTVFAVLAAHWHALLSGIQPPAVPAADEILANMTLAQASINPTLWALQVEVLMAPIILVLYFVERSYGSRVLVAIALVTTALAFTKNWAIWPPLSTNLFAFVLGMLIPTLGRQWAAGLSARAATWAALGALAVQFASGPVLGFYSRPAAIVEGYAAFVLLSVVAYRADIRNLSFLDHWTVRRLGVSSGSYYVLHTSLLLFPVLLAESIVPESWMAAQPVLVGMGVIVVSLLAIAPVCLLVYHLVEATGIAWGRRMLQPRAAVAAD